MNETIAAIATPLQEGAISIIKVSGQDAINIVNKIFSKDLTKQEGNTIVHGFIKEGDQYIDEVLLSVFLKPHTYTKEDVVEINTHGGVYITQKVLSLVLGSGARLARPGEFTQRAYLNGRIDLTQAESVLDMITATSSKASELALKGIKGSVKRLLTPLIQELMSVIAQIEVNIDYPEYDDVAVITSEILEPKLKSWILKMEDILDLSSQTRILSQGVKTVIVGKPNVGKSSLFNALLEEDKAIVTDVAGTTRDLVEGVLKLPSVTLKLIDTAGFRQTVDLVEQIGIQKTYAAITEAELVILLLDATTNITDSEKEMLEYLKDKEHLVIYNKVDLNSSQVGISAEKQDIDYLLKAITEKFKDYRFNLDRDVLNNERQIGLMYQSLAALKEAQLNLELAPLDLIVEDITSAYLKLKEILGESGREDLLDTMFKDFCLGK